MKNLNLYAKKTMIIMVVLFTIIIGTVSYTFSTLGDAKQKVEQNIIDFSRGTYDILIRPPDARTEIEKDLHLVEENYLGVAGGGITMGEWQKVKDHPSVEVAAPVASIGLFHARERTWMMRKSEEDANYYEISYYTDDGVHTYKHNESIYMYDFGSSILEHHIYPSSLEVADDYLGWDIASFIFPVSYHQVVAIDPEEEEKLTGFHFSPLHEEKYDLEAYENGEFSIPIMSLEDVSVPVTMKLTIDYLERVTDKELEKWESEFIQGNPALTLQNDPKRYHQIIDEFISEKRVHQGKEFTLEPGQGHSPFKQNILYVDENNNLALVEDEFADGIGGAYDYHSQRIGYRLEPVVYEKKSDGTLFVKQIGEDELYGAPIYRGMEAIEFYTLNEFNEPERQEDFFGFVENGTFSIQENNASLASAPLGIYGRDMPYLSADPSVPLHPSAVPGSFITTPAHGLIAIDHAEKAKGEAPIDAIRVKVAGITDYDKASAALIQELADEWEKEGFTVDIVAGASLQEIMVEVEGIGEVVQSFTTLGAADTVISSWNALQIVVTLFYSLVAYTFVGFSFTNLLKDREKDEQLLAYLGWSDKLLRNRRLKDNAILLGAPIVIASIGFGLFGIVTQHWSPMFFFMIVSVVFTLVCLGMYFGRNKQPGIPETFGKSVAIQNIVHYRFNLLAAAMQLFFVTILTSFLPFFLVQYVQKTTQTRLGTHIHGEIEGVFIVVIILLYMLSIITVYQSLSRLWEKRAPEMQLFLFLGWEKNAIKRYFIKEVLLWAGISILVGWTISQFILLMMVELKGSIVLISVIGCAFILLFATGSAYYSLSKVERRGVSHFEH